MSWRAECSSNFNTSLLCRTCYQVASRHFTEEVDELEISSRKFAASQTPTRRASCVAAADVEDGPACAGVVPAIVEEESSRINGSIDLAKGSEVDIEKSMRTSKDQVSIEPLRDSVEEESSTCRCEYFCTCPPAESEPQVIDDRPNLEGREGKQSEDDDGSLLLSSSSASENECHCEYFCVCDSIIKEDGEGMSRRRRNSNESRSCEPLWV